MLFALELKWNHLSKFNFYYLCLEIVLAQFMPIEIITSEAYNKRVTIAVINMALDYFNFWPDMILSALHVPVEFFGR